MYETTKSGSGSYPYPVVKIFMKSCDSMRGQMKLFFHIATESYCTFFCQLVLRKAKDTILSGEEPYKSILHCYDAIDIEFLFGLSRNDRIDRKEIVGPFIKANTFS